MFGIEGFEDFNIDQYGSSGAMRGFFEEKEEEEKEEDKCIDIPYYENINDEEDTKKDAPSHNSIIQSHRDFYIDENGVFIKMSTLDFIQETARADSRELNFLMKMCVDLIFLGCHKNRIPDGPVDKTFLSIQKEWKDMCDQCDRLKHFCEERNKAKLREDSRRKKKLKGEKDIRLKRIYNMKKNEEKSDELTNVLSREERESQKEDFKKYLCHSGYGSPLLKDINLSPITLYNQTKDIRRCIIWCLMCISEDIQRLVCCGKFYSKTYKCKLRYVPIEKNSLDEFIHFIDPLKNSFYTCQMSACNFVLCVQRMVEMKGVNHFTNVILKIGRTLETLRIAKEHMPDEGEENQTEK